MMFQKCVGVKKEARRAMQPRHTQPQKYNNDCCTGNIQRPVLRNILSHFVTFAYETLLYLHPVQTPKCYTHGAWYVKASRFLVAFETDGIGDRASGIGQFVGTLYYNMLSLRLSFTDALSRKQMPDARCPMPDARCPMPDARSPIPDPICYSGSERPPAKGSTGLHLCPPPPCG